MLDEIEQLAREIAPMPYGTDAIKLARVLLAVLPVVRAAIEWEPDRGSASGCEGVLADAVVDMVRALAESV